ncbi:MAG: alpha/beta hydrolase [Acidimicrobiia bacterium]|nr:alpha/beta hydrolase [Acidimicrobiia bacterium]
MGTHQVARANSVDGSRYWQESDAMGLPGHLLRLFRKAPSKRRLLRSLALGNKGGNGAVKSADGTELSLRRSGSGSPMVVVHGALDGMNAFSMVELALADHHEVTVYDRRGRGGSSDGSDYSLDREVEDFQAVLGTYDRPAHVVAHSFGAVVAMKAALSGVEMASLVLYEAPMNGDRIPEEVVAALAAAVEDGRPDDGIRLLALDLAGVNAEEIGIALAVPPVRKMLRDGVTSAVRELRALQRCSWERLPITGVRTLLLRGERSDSPVYPTVEQLSTIAAGAEVVSFAGQTHLAHSMDPNTFSEAILEFTSRH